MTEINTTIIGISGKIGCGKTTLAKMLVMRLSPGWLRMSLGDELKKEAAELFRFPLEWAYSPEGKNTLVPVSDCAGGFTGRMTVREILQCWGDIRRKEEPGYWIKKLVNNLPVEENVIVDDIRFIDEVEFIKKMGGRVFRLDPYPSYTQPIAGANHISETELDDYPFFFMRFIPRFGELGRVATAIAKTMDRQEAKAL